MVMSEPARTHQFIIGYGHYQFSKLQDHQVRDCIGDLKPSNWVLLLANSVGRCVVDAYNLIKLTYDESRARPIYTSPVRVPDAADFVPEGSIFNQFQ